MDSTRYSLLERARANNDEAQAQLTRLYMPYLEYRIRRIVKGYLDHSAIESLAWLTIWKVLGQLDSFQPRDERGPFRAWIAKIAFNVTMDELRDLGKTPGSIGLGRGGSQLPDGMSLETQIAEGRTEKEPQDEEERRQIVALAERALEEMRQYFTDTQIECFVRLRLHKETSTEIAADLGITKELVRQNASRVNKRLADLHIE